MTSETPWPSTRTTKTSLLPNSWMPMRPLLDFETPAGGMDATTPMTGNTVTPAAHGEVGGEADGDDESGTMKTRTRDGEEGDGDDGDDDDRHDEVAGVRVEIANLKKKLALAEEQLAKSVQPIMRKRIEGNDQSYSFEIELKKLSIGDSNEDQKAVSLATRKAFQAFTSMVIPDDREGKRGNPVWWTVVRIISAALSRAFSTL